MPVDAVLSCAYGHCTGVFDRGNRFEAGPAYGFHDSAVPKQWLHVASTRDQLTGLFSDASCVHVVHDTLVTSSLGTSSYAQSEAAGYGDERRLRLVLNVT